MDTKSIAKEIYDELGLSGIYKERKAVSIIWSVLDKYDTTLKNESCGCDMHFSLNVGGVDYCSRCTPHNHIYVAMQNDFLNQLREAF